jgi:hypothetical protein
MKCTVIEKEDGNTHEDSEGKYSSLCFYPPTQKTTPAYRNPYLPDALVGTFGVRARALPGGLH